MADKSLFEICEELGLNTDVLDPEKYAAILKEQREYKGHTFRPCETFSVNSDLL